MPKYNAWIQKYNYKTHIQDYTACAQCPPEGECTYKILFRQDQETLKKNLFDKFFSDRARCGEWGSWSSSGYKCSNGEYFRHVFFKKMHKW